MMRPIEPKETAVELVAQAIRQAILRGDFAPGERLPSERKLAAELKVNRLTLRAALGKLATARLLTIRQGKRHLVHDYRRSGGPELIAGLIDASRDKSELPRIVEDLLMVRRMLARVVLERVAQRPHRTPRRIFEAIEAFAKVANAGESIDAIAAADMEVLAALMEATGSTVLQLCFNLIHSVVTSLEPLRRAIYAEPELNAAGYTFLSVWLERRERREIDGLVRELGQRDEISVERIRQFVKGKP